jgi:type IV secretion system protein TrbL
MRTGLTGRTAAPLNAAVGLGSAAIGGVRQAAGRVADHFKVRSEAGARAVASASGGGTVGSPAPASTDNANDPAALTRRFRRGQGVREGVLIAAHTIGQGDGGAASEGPNLKERS